jgi:dephospho-CoA kinase
MSIEDVPGPGVSAPGRRRRMRGSDPLWIVGLVGRAGSGKTTIARAFRARGFPVLEADRIGHEITDSDPEVRAALASEYGADVYRDDGTLDRARVAAKVFADAAALARLNALVHPRIVAALRTRLDDLRAGGHRGPVIVDAALMLSWGFERECDLVIAVLASEAEVIARLTKSRGWTAAAARARIDAQPDQATFAAAADVVIENRGGEAELVDAALREVAARMPVAAREERT